VAEIDIPASGSAPAQSRPDPTQPEAIPGTAD
jgi:hypothetical protein